MSIHRILAAALCAVLLAGPVMAQEAAPEAGAAPAAAPEPESAGAQDAPAAQESPAPEEAAPEEAAPPEPVTLYVAPQGNDEWSGTLPEANADATDGPLATLEAARDAIRAKRADAGGVLGKVDVLVREGTYYLAQPLIFEPQDSGLPGAEVTFAAYPGEHPVLSGGKRLEGWQQEGDLWVLSLPEVQDSDWRFSTLWVNGERRHRARTPNDGFFHTAGQAPATENPDTGDRVVQNTIAFRYADDDIQRWENLQDALVVVLHAWETSYHHITSIDEDEKIVSFTNASIWPFENWGSGQRYFVENVFEALDAPGEWYLNVAEGKLLYKPMPGEDMATAEVVAPVLTQIVQFDGNPNVQRYVQRITLSGFGIHHADFVVGPEGYAEPAAAVGVPAAVQLRGALACSIEGCEISHVNTYGVWLRVGSVANRIAQNEFHDLGAGGIRVGERQRSNALLDVKHNIIDNNFVHTGGLVYPGGVGIWIGQSPLNRITHNEVCDFANSGIAIGYAWGSEEGFSYSNLVDSNHVHHVGQGMSSNLAGIYILGGAWNTIVRGNVIHDVTCYTYGAWGIHADEGSSDLLIENNIVYNITSAGFDQYYGNLNQVRNNIFAFCRDAALSLSNTKNDTSVVFEKNIVVTDNGTPFGFNWDVSTNWQDFNCYWDVAGWPLDFGGGEFDAWQRVGKDPHSVVKDPLFQNVAARDFTLQPGAPALALGFEPLDAGAAGLYGPQEWTAKAAALEIAAPAEADPLAVKPVSEDFENVPLEERPPDVNVFGITARANLRVTDEVAASGERSLCFTDSDGPQSEWQPEMCYTPIMRDGRVTCSFDVYLTPGAILQHDWRTDWTHRRVGPRLKFDAEGKVLAGTDEEPLMTVPQEEWVHVEITCGLGQNASVPATYDLAISVPGQETQRFEGLECLYRHFRMVEKIWFLSSAKTETKFYLDNIRFEKQ